VDSSIKQLAYISEGTIDFDKSRLKGLMKQARRRNKELSVTGMLLVQMPLFLQVLEGPPESVDTVFESIKKDDRHTNIDVIFTNESRHEREYGQWLMGCKILGDGLPDDLNHLDERVRDVLRNARAETETARQLLLQFREVESRYIDI